MKNTRLSEVKPLSRGDYREILLARMAGGDLYAGELLQKIRKADMMLDRLRVALGGKPLYGNPEERK